MWKPLIYLQMDIGYSGMMNEYLAAQGPLSDTCGDFWQVSDDKYFLIAQSIIAQDMKCAEDGQLIGKLKNILNCMCWISSIIYS